ncbi:MAG: AarF/UbiB family protein [Acidobacteriota bacterium]
MTKKRPSKSLPREHRLRFFRVLFFFSRAFARILIRDILINRPGLRWLRGDPLARWTDLARRFRRLAVNLGGVWIKLGQYLSTRVDILPLEVTRELADLQDEVPAEDFEDIRRAVEEELGEPLEQLFVTFMERPLGAASFAQAHEAQLSTGEPVVVKVLRPGIEDVVEVDLRAFGITLSWLSLWSVINQRVDLSWVEEEFAVTTRRELDLTQEARHVEQFALNFADDGEVHVPRVEWELTGQRVLTEENVAYIKITDVERMRANGIEPKRVAKKLYQVFMQQVFVHNFVHCDPHPGNIFVRPLPRDPSLFDEVTARAGDAAEALGAEDAPFAGAGTPFQLLFIDFGMVAEVPQRLRASLRTFLIGLGNRDAAALIQALRDAGSLRPGADLAALEEALEAVFDRFWGLDMSDINRVGFQEAASLWSEFGQLLRETPIQVQADFMFTARAIELLTGITNTLDEAFNPWDEAVPFAQRMAFQELVDWRILSKDLFRQLSSLAKLPAELSRATGMLQRGRLTVRSALAPDTRRQYERLERRLGGLENSVLAAGTFVAGAILYGHDQDLGTALLAAGGVLALLSRIRRG